MPGTSSSSADRQTTSDTRADQPATARALWYMAPETLEIQTEPLKRPSEGELLIRTHFSAISRGTERLVFQGSVPESEWQRMRAPNQAGTFPFPVKYGYSAVGVVEDGPDDWIGRRVFGLYPHQDMFLANPDWLTTLPDGVPLKRATLAANMETALNAIWDGAAAPCDTIVIIGAGIVGLLTAFLASRIPGTDVTVVDPLDTRRPLIEALGARHVKPGDGPTDADLVFHTSATSAGLAGAFACAGFEATIVEMSWYGDRDISAPLGGAFHSRRLKLVSSQVGEVSLRHRRRWPHSRRLAATIQLLVAPELDALVADEIEFSDAATSLPDVFGPQWSGLPPVISYL